MSHKSIHSYRVKDYILLLINKRTVRRMINAAFGAITALKRLSID